MDAIEAESLLATIQADRGHGSAAIQRLGNGEHVVVIIPSRSNFSYWCWSPTDYHSFRSARTCALCDRDYEHVKACSSCNRLVCLTCRRILNGLKCLECYLTVIPADTPSITAQ